MAQNDSGDFHSRVQREQEEIRRKQQEAKQKSR